jgi:hypothetical protein
MRSTADDWHGALLDKLMEATKENKELRKMLAELHSVNAELHKEIAELTS